MNKIAIVGHPSSGYREVEKLLLRSGMGAAQPSRRERLSPQDIAAALCKEHGARRLDELQSEEEVTQIQAGPLWLGMAQDLVLGNLEQPLWGWADPQTIFLLDYWATLDPKLAFVFVYDEPESVLFGAGADGEDLPPIQQLKQQLESWTAYNGAMLRFLLRHRERCVLVHSRQASHSPGAFLQQLRPLVDAPLNAALLGTMTSVTADPCIPCSSSRAQMTVAERYVASQLLASFPATQQLYTSLQASANLPLSDVADSPAPDPASAWQALSQQRRVVEALQAGSRHDADCSQHDGDTEEAPFPQTVQELREENELLLKQLCQVQEELERHYLENLQLKQGGASVATNTTPLTGAADRIRRQLSYRLGEVMIQRSRTVTGWIGLPWALAAEIRAFRREHAQRVKVKLPPIHTYRDAHEAERIKQHLAYRLGSALVKHGKTPIGWIKLPFALSREVREFRRQRPMRR